LDEEVSPIVRVSARSPARNVVYRNTNSFFKRILAMNRVANKVAFVTGAASGIGRAAVLALSREGAHVVITDIASEGAEALAKDIRDAGGRALSIAHDVGDEGSWNMAIDAALREFGCIDILVNNAGIGGTRSLLDTSLAEWHSVMRCNLDSVFLGLRAGVEAMRPLPTRPRTNPGSIINISSILGIVGMSETAAYSASKGAVRLLTKTVAIECAEKGWNVRVNSVHPGFIWTPMVEASTKQSALKSGTDMDTQRNALSGLHPLGRLGTVDEVAAAIVYLASDESAFTTGSELVVDGGYTAR
jgi:3(or 17)beta-hydroxysteroid dehydrogenase